MNTIPFSFPITVFEQASEKVSETITKKRCAIFYKGENRNGGYITDEFAEKLVSTLPYAPIKGIYDADEEDFTDHGSRRDQGRIYGVVPENFNFAWEKRLDDDGVEREYACADVYLFTALYAEANDIVNKGQSMELYGPSIRGSWVDVEGKSLYKYTDACFLGLQVLGDSTMPCFQGASFFSLEDQQIYELLTTLLGKIDQLSIGGTNQMENENVLTFALSDNQKQNAIFKALNPEVVRYYVVDTYETYALIFDFETEKYLKVSYTKDENDNVTVAEDFEEVVAEFVTASEKVFLDQLRAKTENGTFEAVVAAFEKNAEDVATLTAEVETKTGELSTLATEKEELEAANAALSEQNALYAAEVEALKQFKEAVEMAEKKAIVSKYSAKLGEEIVEEFNAKLADYNITDLKKDLAFALVENDQSIFNAEPKAEHGYVPAEETVTGLAALLNKYKK